jgi:hypothetical protein
MFAKLVKRLKPSQFSRFEDIYGFFIKGSSEIVSLTLKYIFNLSFDQQYFPIAWNK